MLRAMCEHSITPLTFDLSQAAARLGGSFTVDWLKGHLHEIPHIKAGAGRGRAGRISFSEQHLIRIVDLFSVEPVDAGLEPEFKSMASTRGPRRQRRDAELGYRTVGGNRRGA